MPRSRVLRQNPPTLEPSETGGGPVGSAGGVCGKPCSMAAILVEVQLRGDLAGDQGGVEDDAVLRRNASVLDGVPQEARRRLVGDLLCVGDTRDQIGSGAFAQQ